MLRSAEVRELEELRRRIEALGIKHVRPAVLSYDDLLAVCRKNDYNNRSRTGFFEAARDAEAVLGVQPVVFVVAYVSQDDAYCYPSPTLFPPTRASHIALEVRPAGSEQERRFNAWRALKVASEILRFEVPQAWLRHVLTGPSPAAHPSPAPLQTPPKLAEAAKRRASEDRYRLAYEVAKAVYGPKADYIDREVLVDLVFGIPIDKILKSLGLPREVLTDRRLAERAASVVRDPVGAAVKILAEELGAPVEEVEKALAPLRRP
jgi:hypothetical protein